MITFKIYYNMTYAHSCNLITKERKGHYIDIDRKLNKILIDNIMIEDVDKVNSVEFIVGGYPQRIDVTPNAPIIGTNIEYKGGIK